MCESSNLAALAGVKQCQMLATHLGSLCTMTLKTELHYTDGADSDTVLLVVVCVSEIVKISR